MSVHVIYFWGINNVLELITWERLSSVSSEFRLYLTHRAEPGGAKAHFQRQGDVDEMRVVRLHLVNSAVFPAAVLAVPPSAVLVVVVVEPGVEVHVSEQGIASDVQVADRRA